MRCQREDGRLPGSIRCTDGRIEPQFDKYQGFCFPFPALNLWWLCGKDRDYLALLKETLIRFDSCLWKTRHLSGDGLLMWDGDSRPVRPGDSVYLPAGVTATLFGAAELLETTV